MTIADEQIKRLEIKSTAGSTLFTGTALLVALTCAQYELPETVEESEEILLSSAIGTASLAESFEVMELDLAAQISRIYEDLLRNQKDLEPDVRHALYTNISDLYV